MANTAKVVKPENLELRLPQGFVAIGTTLMELDVLMLKKTITPRMESLRKSIGVIKAEKLVRFCIECLPIGEKAQIPVVARTITEGDNGYSYLCLCPCGGSSEPFIISGVFLKDVIIDKDSRIRSVPISNPQQRKVAHATH